MQVVFLISTLGPGGAERSITQLAARWAQAGHRVALVTLHSEVKDDFYPVFEGIERRSLAGSAVRGGFLGNLLLVWRCAALYRALHPRVVVSFIDRTNVIAILAALLTGHPVIACERTVPGVRFIGTMWEFLRRRLYRYAAAVVVQSERAKKALDWLEDAAVIPNAVEEPHASAPAPEIPAPYLVLVGRFTEEKRHEMALKCFKQATMGEFSAWRLVCIGDGPLKPALEQMAASLGIADQVLFLGTLANPHPVIARAAFLVSTSRVEGFPMAVAEALALGVPVVATDSGGGVSDLVRTEVDGIIVPRDDESALVEALHRIISAPALRERLASRTKEVLERFSAECVDAQWFELIESLDMVRGSSHE